MIIAGILVAITVLYRIVVAGFGGSSEWLPNFAPVTAIALCGALFFPRRTALVLPVAVLLFSDVIVNAVLGVPFVFAEMLPRYGALLAIAASALALRGRVSFAATLGASVLASLVFYVVSNTGSWMVSPDYAKTAGGWVQALWIGTPGFPPTWTFFRNSLVSDLLFTSLFLCCMGLPFERKAVRPVAVRA